MVPRQAGQGLEYRSALSPSITPPDFPSAYPEPSTYLPVSRTAQAKTGVVLCNLGSPAAPTATAVRAYLREFLSDPRVVELPRWLWQPLLRGVILPRRSSRVAALYASIWTDAGSPLVAHTRRLSAAVGDELGPSARVVAAMRYGEPGLARVLGQLHAEGVERLLLVPLYPQYSTTTTASLQDAAQSTLAELDSPPDLRIQPPFFDAPEYLSALAERIHAYWRSTGGPAQRLLLSFHGLPERSRQRGDPYHDQCVATFERLRTQIDLEAGRVALSFQSRFGPARWLQPYTSDTLERWARDGVRSVDVACPGFVCDCLETLEEIAVREKNRFTAAGGERFRYVPCLNEVAPWPTALAGLLRRTQSDWLAA